MKAAKNIAKIAVLFASALQVGCGASQFSLPSQTATFQQVPTVNNKVDVLYVLDDSSSMFSFRQLMATQASNMITQLNASGMDYHLAVTATSVGSGYYGGTFVGGTYLTNSTPNLVSTLATLLTFNATAGSELERGLYSMQLALSGTNLSSAGASGFLRSDAMLAVIFLSDDNDYSSGTVASYESFLNTVKPAFASGAQSWVVNYVGSTSLTTQCQNFVNVGQRYIDMVTASGGISQSIACNSTSWAVLMTDIQVVISALMTEYFFSTQPNTSTIVVKVNGTVVPQNSTNGWVYKTGTSASGAATYYIEFVGTAIPTLYQTVSVTFTPAHAN